MTLTFIVTTYQRPRLLGQLITSLCEQTEQGFETVFVDDNSADPRVGEQIEWYLNRHPGKYLCTDVEEKDRKNTVRYAVNINRVLMDVDIAPGLLMYLCDDVELAPTLVDTVERYFRDHINHAAGYVCEEWRNVDADGHMDGEPVKRLWFGAPVASAFCMLDHSQIVHRVEYAVPWPTHPLAWAFADGIAYERLLGRVGVLWPVGDETPLVYNKVTDTSVCRQPVEQALERLNGKE